MELGVIQGAHGVLWSAKKKKVFVVADESIGDIAIAHSILYTAPAYLCRDCEKIVIDYNTK